MIDPKHVAVYIPAEMKGAKRALLERIGKTLGKVARDDPRRLDDLPEHFVPIVGCQAYLRSRIEGWQRTGRTWIYWDRGYFRRVCAANLPTGDELGMSGGYYRTHLNVPQMREIYSVPDDRWKQLKLDQAIKPWNRNGRHIVIADTLPAYWSLFSDSEWTKRVAAQLKNYTDRPIVVRPKENWQKPLSDELKNAHALVAHGSIAAVESVVMGCPVFVDPMCAASLVGETDFAKIETPVYPERMPWLHSLAYCQFNEQELIDGTLWRLIR